MTTTVGVVAVGRPSFDVALGGRLAAAAVAVLRDLDGVDVVGDATVHTGVDGITAALDPWPTRPDVMVVIHATFCDSSAVAAVRHRCDAPTVLWAFPEHPTGGRLRLNSLCGLNLAAHRLARDDPAGPAPGYTFVDPTVSGIDDRVAAAIRMPTRARPPIAPPEDPSGFDRPVRARAEAERARLGRARIGVIGDPPDGFETCQVDPGSVAAALGPRVAQVRLKELLARAGAADETRVDVLVDRVSAAMDGVPSLDRGAVRRSLGLHVAMTDLAATHGWDAVAPRCWPECFTEHGGACCTPLALAIGDGLPAACEADALGAVTALVLGDLAGGDAFGADLVDVAGRPRDGSTVVLWHCGAAPLSMARDARPRAGVHVNRRIPVVGDFGLRPGRVTLARFSQSRGVHRLVIGSGEMLDEPAPFEGTSGTVRLDPGSVPVLDTVVDEGLEHHYGFVYGDVVAELEALAAVLGLAVVRI